MERSGRGRERSCLGEESEEERTETGRSETEGRGIARGEDGKREQKTRENYGLPRSRPRRHGAHCLAGCLRGNIDPSLSLPPLPPGSPFDHLSHWDTRRWRGRSSPLSPLVSAPAAERPCLRRTTSWWGVESTARLPPGASLAHNDRDEREKKKGEDGVLLLLPRRAIPRLHPRANRNDSRIRVYIF